ncbi:MAG: riboflavin biosynthesis protein RibF [Gammaproteobacteria bacterium WSBS_2016_MAG_OTU1]
MPVQIIRHIEKNCGRKLALTIGNFDGVHRGHQTLVRMVCEQARQNQWDSAVMTFEPHPLAVLSGSPVRRLGGIREKILQLNDINVLYLLRFSKERAALSGEDFTALLFDDLSVRYLVVGENFRFGRGRQGDINLLRKEGKLRQAEVVGASLQMEAGEPISSGRIRQCLQNGDFAAAAVLLGRPWQIGGRVVSGRGLGKKLGFATANISLSFNPVCEGIFVAAAAVGDKTQLAAVSIGKNPTVSTGQLLQVEAHLIDFEGDLYGQRLSLQLLHKLRDECKYDNLTDLRAAIETDVLQAKEWQNVNAKTFKAIVARNGSFVNNI